ncbi:uncharacterized protein QC763_708760 [Podospora pseudopauciseta]|uniref:Proteophosphoglycan 5 n=2 Tax=Podospora TaxID=5144 RepID=A0ABR0H1Y0_9PEZI|nr:hypothetical protein QC763_708760 [Podospora pseudopauciseta]KAK4668596.1 hypothetical protein QC764_708760 [Podospora pseudoanserina]
MLQQQQQQPHEQLRAKHTPGRRRPKRPGNSPALKNYASENDVPSDACAPVDLGIPLTPQKSVSNSPAPVSSSQAQPNQSGKPKGRTANNKPRPKSGPSTSPVPARHGRNSPPESAPAKAAGLPAAYAGATFHASPAPASLPIPSFLAAKALDSPGIKDTGRVSSEPSPPATDTEASTPRQRIMSAEITREESPLDFFFKAHRAEKESEARRASTANISIPPSSMYSPPAQPQSPLAPRTVPNGIDARRHQRPVYQRNGSSGISTSELDGNPRALIGPAFSTPYNDRLRAAGRINEKQANSPQRTFHQQQQFAPPQQSSPADATERLKQYLAIGSQPPIKLDFTKASSQPKNQAPPKPITLEYTRSGPAPDIPRQYPVAGYARPEYSRPADLVDAEDHLRRVLKIDGLNLGGARLPTNYQSS